MINKFCRIQLAKPRVLAFVTAFEYCLAPLSIILRCKHFPLSYLLAKADSLLLTSPIFKFENMRILAGSTPTPTQCSNSPPPGADDSQMPVGYLREMLRLPIDQDVLRHLLCRCIPFTRLSLWFFQGLVATKQTKKWHLNECCEQVGDKNVWIL